MTSRTRYEALSALVGVQRGFFGAIADGKHVTQLQTQGYFHETRVFLAETWWLEPHGLHRLC